MLIKCPECELQVSDRALNCPHCGYPLKVQPKAHNSSKKNKRRRLPNGFGQISEIKGRNLRKPYRAMISVGKAENGRPIVKPLKPESYFETYNDAYAALVEYNRNPYDLESSLTVNELFEKWYPEYVSTLARGSGIAIRRTWRFCTSVYNMRAMDLRPRHIKGCLENGVATIGGKERTPTPTDQNKIKSLFNTMLDYAVEYELVDKNYSRAFTLPDEVMKDINTVKNGHIVFTEEEMTKLWDHVDSIDFADVVLIQCYSGWRPQELYKLKIENINLEDWYMKGGMKTENGEDRIVPIHSRIRKLVESRYTEAKENGWDELLQDMTYRKYSTRFNNLCSVLKLNPDHRPHDGRKQFITMAKKSGVDEYTIKKIVGHSILDVTEKVYTERDLEWLRSEIEKIE